MSQSEIAERAQVIAAAFLARPKFAAALSAEPEAVQSEIRREVLARAVAAATQGRAVIGWAAGDAAACRDRLAARQARSLSRVPG